MFHSSTTSKRLSGISAAILFALVFLAGFSFGKHNALSAVPPSNVVGAVGSAQLQSADFTPFWKVWNVINDRYVTSATTTTEQDKVWGAVQGLAASLGDPYTLFLPPEENKSFEEEISGNFHGVGMEVGLKDDILTVIAPMKDTPAHRAGIQAGDKILKINDTVTTDMRVDEAVKLIRGPRGTSVTLTVLRSNKQPFEVKITRDVITIPTLDTEVRVVDGKGGSSKASGLRDDGIFVIRLYNFSAPSKGLFSKAFQEFLASGSNRLIIDLRNNPGGFLDASVDIASWFLPQGKVIVREDFGKDEEVEEYRSYGHGAHLLPAGFKMVVLVNEGSASASEIVAGALQEHGVATLVGETTFGKGSVQELVPITRDTSLKLTIARWLTPHGKSISEGGLKPDIEVKLTPKDIEAGKDPQLDKAVELLKK